MTTIPVGFRTGATINNTYKTSKLVFGINEKRPFNGTVSGTTFFSSPDLDSQWVIFKALPSATQPAAGGGFAQVGFYSTKNALNPLSQQAFVDLVNATIRKDSVQVKTPYSAVTAIDNIEVDYFSNFKLNNGSIHLNGSSCITSTLTGEAPGTGAFTYECYFMVDDLNSTQGIFTTRSGNTSDGFDLDVNTSGNLKISWNGTDLLTTTSSISPKSWVHVAVSRTGTTWQIHVNGLTGGTAESGQNFTSTNLNVGCSAEGNNKLRGFISNFRYTKGAKLYWADMLPKFAPFIVNTGTTFLCNTFYGDMFLVDESDNSFDINTIGTPVSTWFSPFEVVNDGLILHLDADIDLSYPGTGTTWYDLSGKNNHGTLVGNATFDTNTIDFDGTNSKITFGVISGFTSGNTWGDNYTISAWVKLDELKDQAILGYGEYAIGLKSNSLKLTTTGVTNNWTNDVYSEAYNFQTGSTWYNITVCGDGVTRKIYVNGDNLRCPGPVTTGLTVSDFSTLTVGVTNVNDWFNGKIGQVLLYTECLTEGQVKYNYETSKIRYI